MKRPSQVLLEAAEAKVIVAPGQVVVVRTKNGEDVVRGFVTAVNPEMGYVRVEDFSSGADLQIDVDPEHYELWVSPTKDPAILLPPQVTVYIRPPSAWFQTGILP